jgi:ribonuclease HI
MYSIKCLTDWAYRWPLRSWKKPAGIFKENMDLIDPILKRIDIRNMLNAKTEFFWVKGHSGDPGNEAADKLAVKGSK